MNNESTGWAIHHKYGICIASVSETRLTAWCRFLGRERRDPLWKKYQRWWYRRGCRAVKVRVEVVE